MTALLIIDFEATCWAPERLPPPPQDGRRYANEIIEIGATLLNGCQTPSLWRCCVQPVINPRLSRFCRELTGMAQAEVDQAETLPGVLPEFRERFGLLGRRKPVFASWSTFDRDILMDDCAWHGAAYPFSSYNHLDLQAEVVPALGLAAHSSLGSTLQAAGLAFAGRPHRAGDDAWNTMRLVRAMYERGWQPRVPCTP